MIESILHLLKIHRKMIFGNPAVVVQDMLGIAPKSFNAVDMIFAFIGKGLTMVQTVMFAKTFERVVTFECISVIDRPLSCILPDMSHQFIGSHSLHNLGIDPAITLQKPKNKVFPCGTPASLAFSPATKVRLINLDLALELACLKLGNMVDRFAQALVDAGHHLILKAKIVIYAIRRLLLVEAGDDTNLLTQSLERFLFPTLPLSTLHIATTCLAYLERTAKNALSASQKVDRTVENIVLTRNHKGIVPPRGYETH